MCHRLVNPPAFDIVASFAAGVTREALTIRCIGVWDTVGALGIPNRSFCKRDYDFHDTELGPRVEYAYQALALDEERGPFQPSIWRPSADPGNINKVVEQVWFPGVHSNIGGGYLDHVLSDAAFFWMAAKVETLLALNLDYICAQADRRCAYALGKLENSRTFWWRFTPPGIRKPLSDPATRGTEYIHESAWRRAEAIGGKPDPHPYRDQAFRDMLTANIERKATLTDFENRMLVRIPSTPPEEVARRRPRRSSLCEKVLGLLGDGQ
jgi:hypothetical protein